ncbi:MAG: GIY-YIG nuclease family protein [Candidatus Paceibacterota bacterium]
MPYFVYIVECSDSTLYTGSTNDIKKRVRAHNTEGVGAKYTRSRKPVTLVYAEKLRDVGAALKRECEVKKFTRKKKLELIASSQKQKSIVHSL